MNNYLGIDIGTTGIKAVVFDAAGHPLGIGLAEYTLETPSPDIVELPAEQYWLSTQEAIRMAVGKSGVSAPSIRAVGVTGQAETLIMTDAAGLPVRKAIVWLDNRAADEAKAIEDHFGMEELFHLSGQTEMLPCWPAAKILWYQKYEPELFGRTARYMMVEDYVIQQLTGHCATCRGLLPSTIYYDIRTGEYNRAMLDFLQINESQLPELKHPGEVIGEAVANESPIVPGTLIVAGPIDHVCGNLGSGCTDFSMISETTGCSLALCARFQAAVYDEERRISTYLGYRPNTFVLLPWAPTAGMLLKHFRDEFGAGMSFRDFDEQAAQVAPGSDGLIILPHTAGAVSPVCNAQARGVAYGITLAHKKAHWARAIMESVAYLLRDNVDVLRKLGADISEIRALGGASKSPLWLQIKANVLNLPVVVTECEEATALGAAMLAAVACGDFPNTDAAVEHMVRTAFRVEPDKDAQAYQEYFQKYRQLNDMLLPTFK